MLKLSVILNHAIIFIIGYNSQSSISSQLRVSKEYLIESLCLRVFLGGFLSINLSILSVRVKKVLIRGRIKCIEKKNDV